MNQIKKMYEGYWQSKKGLENFTDYERNLVLKKLFKKGDNVLDLASGEGAVAEFIQELGCQVTAFDISAEALKKASQRNINTVQGDVEKKLPFKSEQFDTVFWGDNVEHLFSPEKTLKEIYRILKKGGKLIISCPNMGYWRYRLLYLLNGMVPQTEWYGQDPWQWEHIRFFNKSVMSDFLKKSKFKVSSFHGVSRRRIDKLFLKISPELSGMIMVIEAIKAIKD
jgi:methionine biosynthesis protein MetW